jgi:hypothetical protein
MLPLLFFVIPSIANGYHCYTSCEVYSRLLLSVLRCAAAACGWFTCVTCIAEVPVGSVELEVD